MTDDQQHLDDNDGNDARADRLEPTPPDPAVRRGRHWPLLAGGAAAALVLAVTAAFALAHGDEEVGADPSAATASPTRSPAADETDEPAAGLRTVGYRGLTIDVPQQWANVPMPSPNGCSYPDAPFVATYDPTQGFDGNLCTNHDRPRPPESFPTARADAWTPNVQLSPMSAAAESLADGSEEFEGWTLTRKTIGGVRIEILTDSATADVVQQVLSSARTVGADG